MENAEIQTEENQETGTEPQKRNRRKSIRRRLDERLQQLDSLSRNPDLKPTKQAEAAIEATSIEKMLFQAEREDRKDESLQNNERLTVQHEQDTAEIARLKTENEELQRRANLSANLAYTSAPTDPRIAGGLKTIDSLKSLIKFLASEFNGDPAKVSVAVILKFGKTAREYVTALGIDFDSYFCWLNNPQIMTEATLRTAVNPPDDEDLHTLVRIPGKSIRVPA
jgi:hypothetical protein